MGWPDPKNGNQVLSTHNKNPLTHFDMDTIYTADKLKELEFEGDPEEAIRIHIQREIAWLTQELDLLGRDILLSARETARAAAVFYHVLLADRLAGLQGPTTPHPYPRERLDSGSLRT